MTAIAELDVPEKVRTSLVLSGYDTVESLVGLSEEAANSIPFVSEQMMGRVASEVVRVLTEDKGE